jgi:nucleoside 2-deoxyribosyltransferase
MKTIAICASFTFYAHVAEVEDKLTALGFTVLIPETAKAMKAAGDFTTDPLKDTTGEFTDYNQKTRAIRDHFAEIENADAVLVVNDEKHGQPNYIGPNVLMEMAVAFSQGKPIYLLNDIPANSPLLDEIMGMQPISLQNNLSKISTE